MKKERKRHRYWFAITLVIIFILLGVCIGLYYNGKNPVAMNKIAIIPIKGAISAENGNADFFSSGSVGAGTVIGFLEAADKDKNVKAIILNINSPGGTVVASKEIADATKKLNKPVVALIREVGTSGAYWVASAADVIIADPLSVTGSIGVLGSYLEFSELFSEYGVKYQQLTTGEYKDLGNPYKSLSDKDKKVLLKKLETIHTYFVNDVSNNRKRDLTEYGDGLFYLGTEAKEIGLVDELGGKDLAIETAKKLAGISEYELEFYQQKKSFFDLLSSLSQNFGFSIGQGFGDRVLAQDDFEISLT